MRPRHSLFGAAVVVALSMAVTAMPARADSLVPYEIVDYAIPEPLTQTPGDAERGRNLFINRGKGGCLACHKAPIPEEQFHGNVGPDLAGVANRYSEGELRLRIVDPKTLNPETSMPAFYRVEGLHRVRKDVRGKPILTAQEVEDVVAFLMTLDEEAGEQTTAQGVN